MALEEPETESTDPNISLGNHCMDDELHFGMPAGTGYYDDDGKESNERDAIPRASQWRRPVTELERFDLGSSEVGEYDDEDRDDVDEDEKEEASQANDGSMQNVEDWGNSRFHLGITDDDGYDGEDGNDADMDEEKEVLQADDGSTRNVVDWRHSTRECEDWAVYCTHVKYDNGEANAIASDVSEAKSVLQSVANSQC